MEGIRHADVGVGLLAHLGRDHEALDARQVALVGERHQIEHQVQMLVEILGRRARHFRQLQLARRRCARRCGRGARSRARFRDSRSAWRGPAARACGSSELALAEIMSRMLVVWRARNWRSSGVSPWPNRRRNNCRGLLSIGNGVWACGRTACRSSCSRSRARRHCPRRDPARWRFPATGRACPDRCGERRSDRPSPPCRARGSPSDERRTATLPGTSACTARLSPGLLPMLLTTVSWSWNGASGSRIGLTSKSRPVLAGVHFSMIAPCGK